MNQDATPTHFSTIADSSYFLGLVALVNSLRLQGHHDRVTVLDLGLEAWQRAALDGHCDFVLLPPAALVSQDALNAILMSEIADDGVAIEPAESGSRGPQRLAATTVTDSRTLEGHTGSHPAKLLHSWGPDKPWRPASRRLLVRNAYVVCLRRLLAGPDVAVRVPAQRVPRWLRPGAAGGIALGFWTSRARAARFVHTRRTSRRRLLVEHR